MPKTEFSKLNEEYTQLEKDLEVKEERLKSFAEEIAHLRQGQHKKEQPGEIKEEADLAPEQPPILTPEPETPKEAVILDLLDTSSEKQELEEKEKQAAADS